jgi:eukaryotic-like serine/threonine-protein kinase
MTWLSDAAVEHLRDAADWPLVAGDRYEVIEALARGGMGTVYRGRDRELDRPVAIKVLSATKVGDEDAARLRQEARILARLEHPGIVPVYDLGRLADGRIFYVMRLVQGARLDEHVAARPLADRLRLFTRICEPVAFAHAHGVVHRDLKPENVMVGPFGEVLVMDWGAAIIADCGLRIADWVVGTRAYMAPEQARGEAVDARADIYALGGILQFLLAGAPPDAGPLRGPRAVQAIARKARAADMNARYPDALSLAADVHRFLAGDPVSARRETPLERGVRFARKHRVALVLVAAYLVVRAIIAWLAP